MAKHIRRARGRPATGLANQSDGNEADAPASGSVAGGGEGRPEDEPLSDFEAELRDHLGGARPMSEITAGPQGGTPGEDEDGLNEVEQALRKAAEAPIGRKEVGE